VKPTLRMTWSRSSSYLRRAGTPIIIISSCLWVLSNFGFGFKQPSSADAAKPPVIAASDLDHSFAAGLGQTIEPALHPMGVDWRVGVGLISAFAAREVFVSTMAIVFHAGDDKDAGQQQGLLRSMRAATFSGTNQPIFTTSTIIGLIVFFFFSLQCLSTVAVVRSETNSWRIAGLQLLFYTGIGYVFASGLVTALRFAGVH